MPRTGTHHPKPGGNSPVVMLRAKDQHPINRALGFLPRTDSPERVVYRRLINRWTQRLNTEEKRKFVVGVISARGDWEAAMYQQGLSAIDKPQMYTNRAARTLHADPDVRECLRDAFLLIGNPDKHEMNMILSGIVRSSGDPTERIAALRMLVEQNPEIRGSKDSADRLRAEALHAVIQIARDIGVAESPEAAVNETKGATGFRRGEGVPVRAGWRVPDDSTSPANGQTGSEAAEDVDPVDAPPAS